MYLLQGMQLAIMSSLSTTIQAQVLGEVTFQELAEKQEVVTLDQGLLWFQSGRTPLQSLDS
jgi:hypothetical protein